MRFFLMVLMAFLFVGCGPAEEAQHPLTMYSKYGNTPRPDAEWLADKAQYDFINLTPGAWDAQRMKAAADSLRDRNPRINLGSYVHFFNITWWYSRNDTTTYPGRLWAGLNTHFAHTTEGDTASFWKLGYVWDITDPEARAIAIREHARYARENGLKHLMLDWASIPMTNLLQYQPQWWQDLVHGDVDFDRDGIGHWDDPDEQEMLRLVFHDYAAELKAALPPDVMLVPNGRLACRDTVFADLVDGCYVEGFPKWYFGNGDDGSYANALDPDYPYSLWTLTEWFKDGIVMLEDRYSMQAHVYIAACFDNIVLVRREPSEDSEIAFPGDLGLGAPLSKATYKEGILRRAFAEGTIEVRTPTETTVSYRVIRR